MGSAVEDLGGGVGREICGDCNGTGFFAWFPEPPEIPEVCVRCKGTGKSYVMFYKKEYPTDGTS